MEIKNGKNIRFKTVEDEHDRYQYYLMKDAGLLEFDVHPIGSNKESYMNIKITSLGHDFIDTFENKDNFEGAKRFAKERGLDLLKLSFNTMIHMGKEYAKQNLGL